jgi:hypothetical protein
MAELASDTGLWADLSRAASKMKDETDKQIFGVFETKLTEEKIKLAFRDFSGDKPTQLNSVNLQDFAFSLGETWSEETCKYVFKKLDTNESGDLDIDTFAQWLSTPGTAEECRHLNEDNIFAKIMLSPQLLLRNTHRRATEIIEKVSGAGGGQPAATPNLAEPAAESKAIEGGKRDSLEGGIPMSQSRVRM